MYKSFSNSCTKHVYILYIHTLYIYHNTVEFSYSSFYSNFSHHAHQYYYKIAYKYALSSFNINKENLVILKSKEWFL